MLFLFYFLHIFSSKKKKSPNFYINTKVSNWNYFSLWNWEEKSLKLRRSLSCSFSILILKKKKKEELNQVEKVSFPVILWSNELTVDQTQPIQNHNYACRCPHGIQTLHSVLWYLTLIGVLVWKPLIGRVVHATIHVVHHGRSLVWEVLILRGISSILIGCGSPSHHFIGSGIPLLMRREVLVTVWVMRRTTHVALRHHGRGLISVSVWWKSWILGSWSLWL